MSEGSVVLFLMHCYATGKLHSGVWHRRVSINALADSLHTIKERVEVNYIRVVTTDHNMSRKITSLQTQEAYTQKPFNKSMKS